MWAAACGARVAIACPSVTEKQCCNLQSHVNCTLHSASGHSGQWVPMCIQRAQGLTSECNLHPILMSPEPCILNLAPACRCTSCARRRASAPIS